MKRFADILYEEKLIFPYRLEGNPEKEFHYYVTGEFREQKRKYTAE